MRIVLVDVVVTGPKGETTGGLKKEDFQVGDTVTVTYSPSKDGTLTYGWMKMIKYSDGHVFVYRVGSE